jgi:hypothetical protein
MLVQPAKQAGYARQALKPNTKRNDSSNREYCIVLVFLFFMCFTACLEVTVRIYLLFFFFYKSKASLILLQISNLTSAPQGSCLLEVWPFPTLSTLVLWHYGKDVLDPQNPTYYLNRWKLDIDGVADIDRL